MHVLEFPSGRLEQHDDALFVIRPRTGIELSKGDIEQHWKTAQSMVQGKVYLLVDRCAGYSLSFEAQEFLRAKAHLYLAAIAYLVRTPVGFNIASFTVEQLKPHLPARVFTDEEAALAWLRGLRDEAGEEAV